MAGRQRRQLFRTRAEEGTVADQDRTNTLLRESCEGHFEIAIGSGVRAAACRSAMVDWVTGNAGSARTPNTAALGINSRSNCNCFGASSPQCVRFSEGDFVK